MKTRIDPDETAEARCEVSTTTYVTVEARDLTPATNPALKHAFFHPQVEIDGQEQVTSWGSNEFSVQPGKHEIRIYCVHKLYGKRLTRMTSVDVEAGQPSDLEYTIQLTKSSRWEAVLKVNGEPDVTGINIRSESELRQSKLKYIFFSLIGFILGWFVLAPSSSILISIAQVALCLVLVAIYVLWQRSHQS